MTEAVLGALLGAGAAGLAALVLWPRPAPPAPPAALPRRCPLCASDLGPDENLLAERLGARPETPGAPERIVIKGCPRCLRSVILKG